MNYGGLIASTTQASDTSSCVKAIAPEILQDSATILAGAGSTAAVLFDRAGLTGVEHLQLTVEGCNNVEFTITYLNGADCDACTVDTITEVAQTLTVKKGQTMVVPQGLIADVSYVAVDAAGVPVNVVTSTEVSFYGVAYNNPCCPSPVVA